VVIAMGNEGREGEERIKRDGGEKGMRKQK
jgi:hypothetical protein